MDKLLDKIKGKLSYEQTFISTRLKAFLESNKRQDRDALLKSQERMKLLNELLDGTTDAGTKAI